MTTLQQVASRVGCSLATLSQVLNRTALVSDEMVRKVRRAAAELGYRPMGGSLGSAKRRPVIGVLIPSITNPVFAASQNAVDLDRCGKRRNAVSGVGLADVLGV